MTRYRPFSQPGRREIYLRQATLIASAELLEQCHRDTASAMAKIRIELGELRDLLHPPNGEFGNDRGRRPRIPGPAPIGPPADPAIHAWGKHLRFAALAVLAREQRPLTLPEIHRALHANGYRLHHVGSVKQLADALGYEHDIGRARRVARGIYEIGELSPYERRRVLSDAATPKDVTQIPPKQSGEDRINYPYSYPDSASEFGDDLGHEISGLSWVHTDESSSVTQGLHLGVGSAFPARDDCTSMPHL
ncbi:MAG: hypothetical protein F2782_04500, partial [Actinobacteria bacterium]|nr:hypothetical protein [Actinomycetota bacterium]